MFMETAGRQRQRRRSSRPRGATWQWTTRTASTTLPTATIPCHDPRAKGGSDCGLRAGRRGGEVEKPRFSAAAAHVPTKQHRATVETPRPRAGERRAREGDTPTHRRQEPGRVRRGTTSARGGHASTHLKSRPGSAERAGRGSPRGWGGAAEDGGGRRRERGGGRLLLKNGTD